MCFGSFPWESQESPMSLPWGWAVPLGSLGKPPCIQPCHLALLLGSWETLALCELWRLEHTSPLQSFSPQLLLFAEPCDIHVPTVIDLTLTGGPLVWSSFWNSSSVSLLSPQFSALQILGTCVSLTLIPLSVWPGILFVFLFYTAVVKSPGQ